MKTTNGPELLRAELERRKITPAELAEELKIQKSSLSVWLSGRWLPSAKSRNILEDWSKGRIPSRSWDSTEEAAPAHRSRSRRASGAL